MIHKFILILAGLTLIAFGIRVVYLNNVPPYLSNDEISVAYDAYSLGQTGKDEHGNILPISFESLGNRKAPIYSYLSVLPIRVFGNNDYSAKLTSVILGSLTVFILGIMTFFLTHKYTTSVFAAALLAFTPWHIFDSRKALETNAGLFFLVLGLIFIIRNKQIGLAGLLFAISVYSYHTQWLLVPLLIIYLIFMFIRNKYYEKAIKLVLVFLLFSFPLVFDYFSHSLSTQRAGTEMIWSEVASPKVFLAVVNKYFEYLNPEYIFFTGLDLFKNSHPYESGLLLVASIVPVTIGITIIRKYKFYRHKELFIYFLIVAPLVPALTKGGLHQMRFLVFIIPVTILTAIGLEIIYKSKFILFKLLTIFFTINLITFLQIYFRFFPRDNAESYQSYSQIAQFIKHNNLSYDSMYIDTRYGSHSQYVGVPHLYFAYYLHLDPTKIQNRRSLLRNTVYENINILELDWKNVYLSHNSLYIVPVANHPSDEIINDMFLVQEFNDSNEKPAFALWRHP